jgi:hypothetical protein
MQSDSTNLQDKEVTDPTLLYNYLKGRYSDLKESRSVTFHPPLIISLAH